MMCILLTSSCFVLAVGRVVVLRSSVTCSIGWAVGSTGIIMTLCCLSPWGLTRLVVMWVLGGRPMLSQWGEFPEAPGMVEGVVQELSCRSRVACCGERGPWMAKKISQPCGLWVQGGRRTMAPRLEESALARKAARCQDAF